MKELLIGIGALVTLGEVGLVRVREVVGLRRRSRGPHALADVGDKTRVILIDSGETCDVQNLYTGHWLGTEFLLLFGRISQSLTCRRLDSVSLCDFSFAVWIVNGELGLRFQLRDRCGFCKEVFVCLSVLSFSLGSYRRCTSMYLLIVKASTYSSKPFRVDFTIFDTSFSTERWLLTTITLVYIPPVIIVVIVISLFSKLVCLLYNFSSNYYMFFFFFRIYQHTLV